MRFLQIRSQREKLTVPSRKLRGKTPHRRLLGVELLEERRVLASTLVDDNGADCPGAPFTTIQAAIDAAGPNDTIVVCPGTYIEQITIDSSKDGLQLQSKKALKAIIKAPAGTVSPAIVHVDGAQDVDIKGFTITGPLSMAAPGLHTGVFVGGGGSADIEGNRITKIRDEPVSGIQNGIAVLIGRGSTGESGSAEIEKNVIDDYQKGGIIVDWVGSDAEIENNKITGIGTTGLIAQIGVQISQGATAEIENNEISKNTYTGAAPVSAGILLYDSGNTEVEHNKLKENDIGIQVELVDGVCTEISGNEISKSIFFGLLIITSSNVKFSENTVTKSGAEGVYLTAGSTGNGICNNNITENGLDGIHLEASNGNTVKDNKVEKNKRDGIRVDLLSSGNSIDKNKAKKNVVFDFFDDTSGAGTAGTANTWTNNSGKTDSPVGLKKS